MSTLIAFASIRRLGTVTALLSGLLLAGCSDNAPPPPPPAAVATAGSTAAGTDGAPAGPARTQLEYRLGAGDKLRLIVFGEEELSGEFEVDGSGTVAVPLIGSIDAGNRTTRDFENAVAQRLREGQILLDPKVSAEVLNFRPFYIYGEVDESGEFPYKSGMSVMNAIALAGGYSYRANDKVVYIKRSDTVQEFAYPASATTPVYPGDIIRVPERFF